MTGFLLGHLGLVAGLIGAGSGVLSMVFPTQALRLVGAAWQFLSALPKPVFMGACGLLAFLWLRAEGESRHWHKQSDRYEKLYNADHNTLGALRKESKRQQAEVGKVVDRYVTVTKPEVRERVRVIESAPLKGGCQTPDAVMEAGV